MPKSVTLKTDMEALIGADLPSLSMISAGGGTTDDGRKVSIMLSVEGGTYDIQIEDSEMTLRVSVHDLLSAGITALRREIDGPAKELRL